VAEDGRNTDETRPGGPVPGGLLARRGMSLGERLRAQDSYGLLLIGISLVAISSAVIPGSSVGRLTIVALLSVVLLFALRTSGVRPRVRHVALAFVVIALVAVMIAIAIGSDRIAAVVVGGVDALLALAALATVLRRLAQHTVITGTTVAGAACAYLLIGLLFASVYAFLGGLSTDPFFAETSAERPVDYLYFSFITLTTVGYGDLTAAADLGRMLAVAEALTGQLFLVTIVALVVGNLGRTRH
jgi:hypothetical protein